MEKFRKKLFLMIFILLYLLTLSSCVRKNTELRLRIKASSNTLQDQENKLIVKGIVQEILKENRNILLSDLEDEIKFLTKDLIKDEIKVELKDEAFPAKSYNGRFIPSGIYKTVVITIGLGLGNNFWTLLYPDFFNISFEDDKEVEYHSYIYDKIKNK